MCLRRVSNPRSMSFLTALSSLTYLLTDTKIFQFFTNFSIYRNSLLVQNVPFPQILHSPFFTKSSIFPSTFQFNKSFLDIFNLTTTFRKKILRHNLFYQIFLLQKTIFVTNSPTSKTSSNRCEMFSIKSAVSLWIIFYVFCKILFFY